MWRRHARRLERHHRRGRVAGVRELDLPAHPAGREAERVLAKAEIDSSALKQAADRRAAEISRLQSDVESARAHRASIDKPLALQAAPAGKTCVGRRGYTWNCSAGVQAAAVAANATAMKAHADELKAASEAVRVAEERPGGVAPAPDTSASDAGLVEARRQVADARSMNPMFRVAAAWQRTPVEEMTLEQFEQVKHWAVIVLSIATAATTALAAIIASLPERSSQSSKLARAIRAMVAARRKTIRRLQETVRVEYRDRTKVLYVPVDPQSGRVLDPDRSSP